MDKLTTSLVTIEHAKGGTMVLIKHRQTGMVTAVSIKQLENWAIRQLRGALTPAKVSV